jgi:methyl-accepting chemotaxis protein
MTRLPTASELFTRWLRLSALVSFCSTGLIALYLLALLRLPPDQLAAFWKILGVAFLLLFGSTNVVNRRMFEPLLRALDARGAGALDAAGLHAGFAAACDLPRKSFLVGNGWWAIGGVIVATPMKLWFPGYSWLSWTVMLAAALSGGLVSMIFCFFLLKRLLEPIREAFAAEIADPAQRRALVRPVPLGRKLGVAIVGGLVVTMGFAVLMAEVRASRALEGFANRVQEDVLARAADALASEGRLLQPGVDAGGEVGALGGRLLLLDPAALRVEDGPSDALLPSELRAIRDLGVDAGASTSFDSPNVFAWRRVERGVLVAVARPGALAAGAGRTQVALAAFAAVCFGIAVGMARLVAGDVGSVTHVLAAQVERVAAGDLRPGRVVESEDELGDLARGFARMAGALHDTVSRVADAARGVERTASEIASVSEEVAGVTADQVQGIERVSQSMSRIRGEVGGIADSAHGLSNSVEESSSSVLELGVTGEQLNQNALALSARVSEVSGSIEQMMQSAREILGSIEDLAGASAETSSSMEEMAASLREMDANATEMARLSSHVVELAEHGRRQVGETIGGMEAIQRATDTAQGVIHGLGDRAGEIGKILNVIDDVADETNLLALNAAIIAAQAGEHGKAFSVVADEIKDLADKVLASTKEIGGLIRAVQDEVGNAVGAIEGGARSVDSGVELSAQAGVALEKITTAARESGHRIGEIVTAVQEQSRAATHVVGLMERVRERAERIRAAGGEQARGNEVVLRNASAMREVAHQVSGATQEQARGAHRMRETIESVRAAVEQINHSLQEQSSACRQIAELLERVVASTGRNEESALRMRQAMGGLLREAEGLREGVRHFQV